MKLPTPVETHVTAGDRIVWVKRDDLISARMPNGKLRGVLPLMEALRDQGASGVVNAAASHSNSHALTGYAATTVGLPSATVVNTNRHNPATLAAQDFGAEVILTQPSHLGPLRSAAARIAEERGWVLLPWAYAHPVVIAGISQAVEELTSTYDGIVVPIGGGGYAAAIYEGVRRLGLPTVVYAVPTLDDRERATRRLHALLDRRPTGGLVVTERPDHATPTPWPSDARYEHRAWSAMDTVPEGRLLFWSVGRPVL